MATIDSEKARLERQKENELAFINEPVSIKWCKGIGLILAQCLQHKMIDSDGTVAISDDRDISERIVTKLAWILLSIANGEDARDVFGQRGRSKPSNDSRDFQLAMANWSARAKDPGKPRSKEKGLAAARSMLKAEGFKMLTDSTIEGIVNGKKNIDSVLKYFELDPDARPVPTTKTKADADRIREYLRRKSPRKT